MNADVRYINTGDSTPEHALGLLGEEEDWDNQVLRSVGERKSIEWEFSPLQSV